jgi:hypothetical protein
MLHDILPASPPFPTLALWTNAAVLGAAGFVNLTALAPVRRVYARWDISAPSYVLVGMLQLLAAGLLLVPELRLWGIALAALIAFGAVVLLLDRERYLSALPIVLFLVALIAVALSVPQSRAPIHYMAVLPAATHAFS